MILHKKNKAFTLIELIVGITIISIIALGATSLNFNRLNNKQKIDIYTNKIKTNYENIRNKALSGKGIGINLEVPKYWEIDFSKSGSGQIITKAYSSNGVILESTNFEMTGGYSIISIKCGEYNDLVADYEEMSYTGTINFTGGDIKLKTYNDECGNNKARILQFRIHTIAEVKTIKINTLSGLIEIK